MNFERHLFISYAHDDNLPIPPDELGWISRFHASLEAMLTMRLGRKAQIWRDQKLSGNDLFADEIIAQFSKTAILVSVITPRYVESEWCLREFNGFCKAAAESGGLALDNKTRVMKVIKTPIRAENALPPFANGMLGYEFYTLVNEAPLELDPAYGLGLEKLYNVKMAKLAWDVKQLLESLKELKPDEKPLSQQSVPSRPAVYLAQCSSDRRGEREQLESELRLNGYRVLPDRQLPTEEAPYIADVTQLLAECKLSIHLVGTSYGLVPEGSGQKSVVVLQNDLAAESSRSAGLRRLIWLPEGTTSTHPGQQQFIQALHSEAAAQLGADLITADLEIFKGAMHACLRQLEKPEPPKTTRAAGTRVVYLICDERDRAETIPLRRYLKGQGIDVSIPVFEGDSALVRGANQEILSECDAALVFYGAGEEAWKHSVDTDLKKARGYRGERPPLVSYTYLSSPSTAHKQELIALEEVNLIDGLQTFSEAAMKPLIDQLR